MKTKVKEVYYCDHCNKNGLVKWMIEKHEKFCSSDPNNQSMCSGCANVIHSEKEFFYDGYSRTSSSFECSVKKCGLIPLIAQRKGLPEKYPDTFKDSIQMPSECSDFKRLEYI